MESYCLGGTEFTLGNNDIGWGIDIGDSCKILWVYLTLLQCTLTIIKTMLYRLYHNICLDICECICMYPYTHVCVCVHMYTYCMYIERKQRIIYSFSQRSGYIPVCEFLSLYFLLASYKYILFFLRVAEGDHCYLI